MLAVRVSFYGTARGSFISCSAHVQGAVATHLAIRAMGAPRVFRPRRYRHKNAPWGPVWY